MYIPRGLLHEAVAVGVEPSLHLTFGVEVSDVDQWDGAFQRIIEVATVYVKFLRDLSPCDSCCMYDQVMASLNPDKFETPVMPTLSRGLEGDVYGSTLLWRELLRFAVGALAWEKSDLDISGHEGAGQFDAGGVCELLPSQFRLAIPSRTMRR